MAALLVRWPEVPLGDGPPLALTAWLEADQAEVTVLYRGDEDETLRATGYRFCALRERLEPAGAFALVPA
ncbi:MAG: hypothetical protein JO069_07380 [Verrucomicrobia bacterium]|nr:hypothetical protein [Verrucomicrobiota bacterium]